jgi:U3 small nucleolar RNA-associated protein 19
MQGGIKNFGYRLTFALDSVLPNAPFHLYTMAKDPTARIQLLEKHLTKKADSFNPNPLLELVSLARHDDPQVVHSAIWALHRVFIKLVGDGRLGRASLRTNEEEESDQVDMGGEGSQVRDWIVKRLGEYVDVLGGLLRDSEEALRVCLLLFPFIDFTDS